MLSNFQDCTAQHATYREELFLAYIRFLIHCGLWSLARDLGMFLRILYRLAGDCFKVAVVLLGSVFLLRMQIDIWKQREIFVVTYINLTQEIQQGVVNKERVCCGRTRKVQ